MKVSQLQTAIDEQNYESFVKHWEKTKDKTPFLLQNNQKFQDLIKRYLNREIYNLFHSKCKKNCEGQHGLEVTSLKKIFDAYGKQAESLLLEEFESGIGVDENKKKHYLTVLAWTILSYTSNPDERKFIENLYQKIPDFDMNILLNKKEIYASDAKKKEVQNFPINKLLCFENIAAYFFNKHIESLQSKQKSLRYAQRLAHFMKICSLLIEAKKTDDPNLFHQAFTKSINETKLDSSFNTDNHYLKLIRTLATIPLPYLLESFHQFPGYISQLCAEKNNPPAILELQTILQSVHNNKKEKQEIIFIEKNSEMEKESPEEIRYIDRKTCTINQCLIDDIVSGKIENSVMLNYDNESARIGNIVVQNNQLFISIFSSDINLILNFSSKMSPFASITVINRKGSIFLENVSIKTKKSQLLGASVLFKSHVDFQANTFTIVANHDYHQGRFVKIKTLECAIKAQKAWIDSSLDATTRLNLEISKKLELSVNAIISTASEHPIVIKTENFDHNGKIFASGTGKILFDVKQQAVMHKGSFIETQLSDLSIKADSSSVKGALKVPKGTLDFGINKKLILGMAPNDKFDYKDSLSLERSALIEVKHLHIVAGAYFNLAKIKVEGSYRVSSLLRLEVFAIIIAHLSTRDSLISFDALSVRVPNFSKMRKIIKSFVRRDFNYLKNELFNAETLSALVSSGISQLKLILPMIGQALGVVWGIAQLIKIVRGLIKQIQNLLQTPDRSLRDFIPLIVTLKKIATLAVSTTNQSSVLVNAIEEDTFDPFDLAEIDKSLVLSSLKSGLIAVGSIHSDDSLIQGGFFDFNIGRSQIDRNLLSLDAGNIKAGMFVQEMSEYSANVSDLMVADMVVFDGHQKNLDHSTIFANKAVVSLSGDLNQHDGKLHSNNASIQARNLNQNGGDIEMDQGHVAVKEHHLEDHANYRQNGGTYQSEHTEIEKGANFEQNNTLSHIDSLNNNSNLQAKNTILQGKKYQNTGKADFKDSQIYFDNYQSSTESQNSIDHSNIVGIEAHIAGETQLQDAVFLEEETIKIEKESSLHVGGSNAMQAKKIDQDTDSMEVEGKILFEAENKLQMGDNSHITGDGAVGLKGDQGNIGGSFNNKSVIVEFNTLTQQENSEINSEELQITATNFDQKGTLNADESHIRIAEKHTIEAEAELKSQSGYYEAKETANKGNVNLEQNSVEIGKLDNHGSMHLDDKSEVIIEEILQNGELEINDTKVKVTGSFADSNTSRTTVDNSELEADAVTFKGKTTTKNEAQISSATTFTAEESAEFEVQGKTLLSAKNMLFEAQADLKEGTTLSLKAENHLEVTDKATFNGEEATLTYEGKTANLKGSGTVSSLQTDVGQLEDVEDFFQGTGASGKLTARDEFLLKVDRALHITGEIERDSKSLIASATEIKSYHAQTLQGMFHGESTQGDIQFGADFTAKDLLLHSARDVITSNQHVTAYNDAKIYAGRNFDNTQGTLKAGRNAQSHSEGETYNVGGVFKGGNYAEMTSVGKIYNTATVYYTVGSYDLIMHTNPGQIIGGAGEGFDGVAVHVKSEDKVMISASDMLGVGEVIVEGKYGIEADALQHDFLKNKEKHHHGLRKETVKTYETQVFGNTFASANGKITMYSPEGAITGSACQFMAADGTHLKALGPVELYDVKGTTRTVSKSHGLGGLMHDTSKHNSEFSVPTRIACPTQVTIESEADEVHLSGVEIFGHGRVDLIGKNIEIKNRKYEHSDSRHGNSITLSALNQGFYNSLDSKQHLDFHSPSAPFFENLKQLTESEDGLEIALTAIAAGKYGIEGANWVIDALREKNIVGETLDHLFSPTVSVGLNHINEQSSYQTMGKGGIDVGEFNCTAKGTVSINGTPVHTSGNTTIQAQTFELNGVTLESSHHSSSTGASIGVSAKGLSGSIEHSQSDSKSDHFINQQLTVDGKLTVVAEKWIQDGANVTAKSADVDVDTLTIISHLDHTTTTQNSGSASTQGGVSASHFHGDSSTLEQKSGIHIEEALTDDNFKVKHLEMTAGEITSKETVSIHPQTAKFNSLNENESSHGYSGSLNLNTVATILQPTTSTQFDTVGLGQSESHSSDTVESVIHGAKGTDFQVDTQTGNVHTDSTHSTVNRHEDHHNYSATIPIKMNGVLDHFKDNMDWLLSDTPEKNEPVEETVINNEKELNIPQGDYCQIPATEIQEPVEEDLPKTDNIEMVETKPEKANVKITESDIEPFFQVTDLSNTADPIEVERLQDTFFKNPYYTLYTVLEASLPLLTETSNALVKGAQDLWNQPELINEVKSFVQDIWTINSAFRDQNLGVFEIPTLQGTSYEDALTRMSNRMQSLLGLSPEKAQVFFTAEDLDCIFNIYDYIRPFGKGINNTLVEIYETFDSLVLDTGTVLADNLGAGELIGLSEEGVESAKDGWIDRVNAALSISSFFHDVNVLLMAEFLPQSLTAKPMERMEARLENIVNFAQGFFALPREERIEKGVELVVPFFIIEPLEILTAAGKLHKTEEALSAISKLSNVQKNFNEKAIEKLNSHFGAVETEESNKITIGESEFEPIFSKNPKFAFFGNSSNPGAAKTPQYAENSKRAKLN